LQHGCTDRCQTCRRMRNAMARERCGYRLCASNHPEPAMIRNRKPAECRDQPIHLASGADLRRLFTTRITSLRSGDVPNCSMARPILLHHFRRYSTNCIKPMATDTPTIGSRRARGNRYIDSDSPLDRNSLHCEMSSAVGGRKVTETGNVATTASEALNCVATLVLLLDAWVFRRRSTSPAPM